MSISSTSPLRVLCASCSSSHIIAFFFTPPYASPLYLLGITITRNLEKGACAIAGRLRPGSGPYSAGNGELQANESEFLRLSSYVPLAGASGRFTIELRYDSSNLVTEIICATTSSVV